MRSYRYLRIDVFTDKPFGGNPLAVFPTAQGLSTEEMQMLAKEMNLSETTFVLPSTKPNAVARVRIFTIDRELPLAGHPVVGTAFALASTGGIKVQHGKNHLQLELGVGVLPVVLDVVSGKVVTAMMTQRPPQSGMQVTDARKLATALSLSPDQLDLGGLTARVVDTGIPWLLIPIKDRRALKAIRADGKLCDALAKEVGTDLFHAFTQDTGDPDCAVRARHVWWGNVTSGEDPVTGSAIGCIASYLVGEGVILASPDAQFSIEQGDDVGRPGKVLAHIGMSGGIVTSVQIGGAAVHVGTGEIWLE